MLILAQAVGNISHMKRGGKAFFLHCCFCLFLLLILLFVLVFVCACHVVELVSETYSLPTRALQSLNSSHLVSCFFSCCPFAFRSFYYFRLFFFFVLLLLLLPSILLTLIWFMAMLPAPPSALRPPAAVLVNLPAGCVLCFHSCRASQSINILAVWEEEEE